MAIDWSLFKFPKVKPGVLSRKEAKRANESAWRKTSKAVDARDAVDEAPVCFITGKRLQSRNTLDEWTFRDRAHLEARSKAKSRRYETENVISCCRAVHRLIDASALFLLTKKLQPAKTRASIYCVAWNRRMVAKKEEPCRIRKGLPVVELEAVRD